MVWIGLLFYPSLAMAHGTISMDGSQFPLWFAFPFVGFLACLALMPILAGKLWHAHYGKVIFIWILIAIGMMGSMVEYDDILHGVGTTFWHQYFPFLCLIGSLFIISGGVHISTRGKSSPSVNTGIIALGVVLANLIGTTGASMLLIRPLIRLNKYRRYNTHIVIFFIFLVANIGGCLTPIGDPPLFLGFLSGISFFWTLQNLWQIFLTAVLPLLAIFWLIDRFFFYHDSKVIDPAHLHPDAKIKITGKRNLWLLGMVVLAVIASGLINDHHKINLFGVNVEVFDLMRDFTLIGLGILSLKITPVSIHKSNEFSWKPLQEVILIFAAIFVTILPVSAMLDAGTNGAFEPVIRLANPSGVPHSLFYFWLTGFLSAFLDNAPTYLIFFHMAGGNPEQLMGSMSVTLAAISTASVLMGALTYIGNAPNFMIKSIADHMGVKMPGFIGYMAWSFMVLMPLFLLLSWLYFCEESNAFKLLNF